MDQQAVAAAAEQHRQEAKDAAAAKQRHREAHARGTFSGSRAGSTAPPGLSAAPVCAGASLLLFFGGTAVVSCKEAEAPAAEVERVKVSFFMSEALRKVPKWHPSTTPYPVSTSTKQKPHLLLHRQPLAGQILELFPRMG